MFYVLFKEGEGQGKLVTAERVSDFTLRSCGERSAKGKDDCQRLKDALISSRAKEAGPRGPQSC